MKTERRHDLKHNSLDAELVKILDYLKKNVKGILLAVLVLVAAISAGWAYLSSRQTAFSVPQQQYSQLKGADISKPEDRLVVLAGFTELATQTGNAQIAALACVEAGDICLMQDAAGDPVMGVLDIAQTHYQRVIDEFSDNHAATGRAYLGLARLAEGKGDLDLAGKYYQNVVELGSQTSGQAVKLATQALAAMDELKKPVRLATSRPAPPAPPTPPTTQSATQPATAPAAK